MKHYTCCAFAVILACIGAVPCADAQFAVKFIVTGWIGPTQQDTWCAQLDADTAMEFVVMHTGGRNVSIYDGSTGVEEFSADFPRDYPTAASSSIIDIDDDGLQEVLVRVTWPSDLPDEPSSATMVIDTGVAAEALAEPESDDLAAATDRDVAFPNPASTTMIRFHTSVAGPAVLQVFDLGGRVIRTLLDTQLLPAGEHQFLWDGRDEHGSLAPSGQYYWRGGTTAGRSTSKLIVLH